ncbi:MAG: hypothetical protein WBA12_03915, partial [Catalinimonas sp.]
WGTDRGGPRRTQPDLVRGAELYDHWHTVYFGDDASDRVFFVQQLEPDTLRDLYTYMGNTAAGNASSDGMVVFGFGRAPGATPLLRAPQRFRVGFVEGRVTSPADHRRVLQHIEQLTP